MDFPFVLEKKSWILFRKIYGALQHVGGMSSLRASLVVPQYNSSNKIELG
jgi:hypothetical protein